MIPGLVRDASDMMCFVPFSNSTKTISTRQLCNLFLVPLVPVFKVNAEKRVEIRS